VFFCLLGSSRNSRRAKRERTIGVAIQDSARSSTEVSKETMGLNVRVLESLMRNRCGVRLRQDGANYERALDGRAKLDWKLMHGLPLPQILDGHEIPFNIILECSCVYFLHGYK